MLRADHVIAGSEFIAAHIRDCYDFPPEGEMHRLSVIARGIDTDYFSPETVNKDEIRALRAELGCGEARILLMPARWSAWKGHATVLEALALLPSDLDYCMVFIGKEARPGRWRHELESRFLGHPAEKRLRRVASSGSMAAWYALSYGVLMPSTAPETFGRVAVEAQAMERPIIATSLGATSETIVDSRTGWLVPPENPVALAEAMAALLRLSAEDYEAMGKAGRRHATERFALETMCEKTVEVYERLMRGA
jgi:glycosyltransferase involved in cell wall biosynthesis